MKVALSTIGKFHTFDLAYQLYQLGALSAIFTGYPRFKLKAEQIPQTLIHTFPWIHAPYMRMPYRESLPKWLIEQWEYFDKVTLDYYVSRNMPNCDVFVGLSSSAILSGEKAHKMGAKYVCDRGSSHIKTQDNLMREEHAVWGVPYEGIDPRVIAREESEYAAADCITVPSIFSERTFVDQGISAQKIKRIPYGVNLNNFYPLGEQDPNEFNVLFAGGMSLRKGIPYLLKAFQKLKHPNKKLVFAGAISPSLVALMRANKLWDENISLLGHLQQSQLREQMSKSHVLVLPSIEDGFGMVLAQAMACGCPVIATSNTGAEDIIDDGKNGFIVPIRNVSSLAEKLQLLADNKVLHQEMRLASINKVREIGGWVDYGKKALSVYQGLIV